MSLQYALYNTFLLHNAYIKYNYIRHQNTKSSILVLTEGVHFYYIVSVKI